MLSNVSCRLLTISVDDGHPSDLRVAEMLAAMGLTATFYIPRQNPERQVITSGQMRELAKRFEVGSHTMNHLELTRLPPHSAWHEIHNSKRWVEDTVSYPSIAFCYPRGKHNRRIASMARDAGFCGARTVTLNRIDAPRDPFRWGVSTQAYSHSLMVQLRHGLREANIAGLWQYGRLFRFTWSWDEHFRLALDRVEAQGGIAHLFLHGWEIEERDDWARLHSVLCDAASRARLTCITNGELFRRWPRFISAEDM